MKPDQHLDDLIRRHLRQPLPSVPGDLEGRVWREIRARQRQNVNGDWLARWLRLWREPRVAFAGALATVAIGVGMSWAAAVDPRGATARQALDLGVFSAEAPSLPSTLLFAPVNFQE